MSLRIPLALSVIGGVTCGALGCSSPEVPPVSPTESPVESPIASPSPSPTGSLTDSPPNLLTDPFLQNPGPDSVSVVWFTEFEGSSHLLTYGSELEQTAVATTRPMTRLVTRTESGPVRRDVWRHEAIATGLTPGSRVPYFVSSQQGTEDPVVSGTFTLQPLPPPGQPLRILMTSDHQLMPNTHINLQKVVETVGQVDAVFLAGDLVNIPDQFVEWFERTDRGIGFFPALQGRAQIIDPTLEHTGGEIIQHAHLFPALGNHEVMGRIQPTTGFANYPSKQPRWYAEIQYNQVAERVNPEQDPDVKDAWIQDHSWNTVTYEEIFSVPTARSGKETYYSVMYGDVALFSLFVTRPWRKPQLDPVAAGKYQEAAGSLTDPDQWLFGDFVYEPYGPGSDQFEWLAAELQLPEVQDKPIKYVMLHQVSRGLGDNAIPLMVDPVLTVEYSEAEETTTVEFPFPLSAQDWRNQLEPLLPQATALRYDYPRQRDHWVLALEPLLSEAGVQLVHHGHSHLWYRLVTDRGLNIMETSNVGNSYGSYLEGYKSRATSPIQDPEHYDVENYALDGDPYEGDPVFPSEFSPMEHQGQPLPSVDSNDLTVFSILETESGLIKSYVVDIQDLDQPVKLFDQFRIRQDIQ